MTEDKSLVKSEQRLRLFSSRRQPPLLVIPSLLNLGEESVRESGDSASGKVNVSVTNGGDKSGVGDVTNGADIVCIKSHVVVVVVAPGNEVA